MNDFDTQVRKIRTARSEDRKVAEGDAKRLSELARDTASLYAVLLSELRSSLSPSGYVVVEEYRDILVARDAVLRKITAHGVGKLHAEYRNPVRIRATGPGLFELQTTHKEVLQNLELSADLHHSSEGVYRVMISGMPPVEVAAAIYEGMEHTSAEPATALSVARQVAAEQKQRESQGATSRRRRWVAVLVAVIVVVIASGLGRSFF